MKTLLNKTLMLIAISVLVFGCSDGDPGIDGTSGSDGNDGTDGTNGTNGTNGLSSLITVTAEAAGDNCEEGGFLIQTGVDDNEDGTLGADEVDGQAYICNGVAGSDVLIATTEIGSGDDCENGGFLVESGNDTNGDGVLDEDEITDAVILCNGDNGSSGVLSSSDPLKMYSTTIGDMTALTESEVDVADVFTVNSGTATMIMTSLDILPDDPSFVYGSYTDGCALYEVGDGSYAFVVNQEADFSIARIRMNENLEPVEGDIIVNSLATAFTAQCSGSGIYPDDHGFGPLYLSGGEWGGDAAGVYVVDPFKSPENASIANRSAAMGEWATENAVALGKDAYPSNTVVLIGDDDSNNDYPESHFGMYVGARGDLYGGDLYVMKGANPVETGIGEGGQLFEMGMEEGTAYDVEWVEMTERSLSELNQEAIDSSVIGFQRIEDIDWQRGDATAQRTIFFCVTGRFNSDYGTELTTNTLANRGTTFGRIYMLEMNETDPTGQATLTCILDGDNPDSDAWGFHSPDNIMVTENFVYVQEDPNGYNFAEDMITVDGNQAATTSFPKIYQYNITSGALVTVIEANQDGDGANGIYSDGSAWEFTGMIDVTDIIGAATTTFLCGVQVHDWGAYSDNADIAAAAVRADGALFHDPNAIAEGLASLEGSFLFKIEGLE